MNTPASFPDELAAGKNVLFITTKNLDYIRNAQEIGCLRRCARSLRVLGSRLPGNGLRTASIWLQLLFLRMGAYDTVFIGFAPQLVLPFWGWKFRRQTVIADLFISFYDTLVYDRQLTGPHSPLGRFVHWMDARVCRRADAVFADTRAHAGYFHDAFGLPAQKTHVFYLRADESIFYPRPVPPRKDGKFEVLYFGSVLPLQGVDVILHCAQLLEPEENIVFDFIGPLPPHLRRRFGALPQVRFTPWLSQPALAARIAKADLCLAGHFNAQIQKASRTIPGKAYIYRAMGKPMVLGDNPANHELYEADGKTVYYVKMGDAKALAETIRTIAREAVH